MTKTTDGIKIIDEMIGDDAELREMCEQASVNALVAQLIYDARTEAGSGARAESDRRRVEGRTRARP